MMALGIGYNKGATSVMMALGIAYVVHASWTFWFAMRHAKTSIINKYMEKT